MNHILQHWLMRRLFWSLAFVAFLAGYHRADAQEAPHVEMVIMGKSWHFGGNPITTRHVENMRYVTESHGYDYNDWNPGLGIEYRWPNGLFVGTLTYLDSYRKQAYAAYAGYQLTHHVSSDWAVFVAGRAGYLNGSGFHGAMFMPTVGVQYKRVSIELEVIPKFTDHGVNEIGMFARWRF